jgi:trimeric autotransporter adhesin
MMNICNGNVITDGSGTAVVTMPAWFEALNTDFSYQLTVIGHFAPTPIASRSK